MELNQTVRSGDFDLHFTQARLQADSDGLFILEFDVESTPEILGFLIYIEDSLSSGSEFDQGRGVWVSQVTLPELPVTPVDIIITNIQYKIYGPWEITWQP